MADHKQNEMIVTGTNSNISSSITENNDVKSSCNKEVLDVDKGSKTIKSIGDESQCETMPLISPSIPVMSVSTSPISAKSPSSNLGSTHNEEKTTPSKFTMSLVSDYGFSDDEDAILEMRNINKDLLPVIKIKEEIEIIDSDMDENVSKENQNENIEFTPQLKTSSELLNEENKEDIVEIERHNIDKDLLPVVLIKDEVEIIDCEMEESITKEPQTEIIDCDLEESITKGPQNEKINTSPAVSNSFGLLAEENTDAYRYTVDIASGTDDSESDSDDSSSDGFSSSSESSSESEDETMKSSQGQAEQEALKAAKEVLEGPSPDDLAICKLPPIEDLRITVSEEESQPIGTIFSIVEQQVVIQALPNVPPIDLDSVLFLENGKQALGKVFDVFGPVQEPLYTVRFNSNDHIKEKGFNIGDRVYFAPQTEHTQFVVLSDLMRAKGSDASWENNKEPPSKFIDYSDDEQESAARQQRKQEKLLQDGIPVNEFKPQRKRLRGGGQGQARAPNPFSNSGSRPSRAPVRYAQRTHHQPWTRPSGPRDPARVPPAMPHQPPNPNQYGHYDQWNGEYQFGAPPQFPPTGPSNNWHQTGPGPNWHQNGPGPNWHQAGSGNNWPHAGPRMPMGPPGINNGPPPHMGQPPPHHGGPPPMFGAPGPQHQPPPPPYSDAPVPHHNHNHAYPGSSQENWWTPGPPPGAYYPPPPPPTQRNF